MPNHALQRTGAMRLSFCEHWLYNIIRFRGCALPASVAELVLVRPNAT